MGQKVKLARPDNGSLSRGLFQGDQGVIESKCITRCWRVNFQGRENPYQYGTRRQNFPCFPEELEPITPPHEPGSWGVIEQLIPGIREGVSV